MLPSGGATSYLLLLLLLVPAQATPLQDSLEVLCTSLEALHRLRSFFAGESTTGTAKSKNIGVEASSSALGGCAGRDASRGETSSCPCC